MLHRIEIQVLLLAIGLILLIYLILPNGKTYTSESWERELEDSYDEDKWLDYQKTKNFKH